MKRFKNILFIADREDGLQAALTRAVSVARTNEARLTVMDITPDTGLADYFRQRYGIDLNAQLREHRLRPWTRSCNRIRMQEASFPPKSLPVRPLSRSCRPCNVMTTTWS